MKAQIEYNTSHTKETGHIKALLIFAVAIALGVMTMVGCSAPQLTNEHTPIRVYVHYINDTTVLLEQHYEDGIDSIYHTVKK
jgi:hypothetical protein